jgi:hypothetical protein
MLTNQENSVNRYPTKEELKKIEEWPIKDSLELMDFAHSLWEYADCGYWVQKGKKYYISTAGWSGNEEIISALEGNRPFWILHWQQSRRGGHYIFHVRS